MPHPSSSSSLVPHSPSSLFICFFLQGSHSGKRSPPWWSVPPRRRRRRLGFLQGRGRLGFHQAPSSSSSSRSIPSVQQREDKGLIKARGARNFHSTAPLLIRHPISKQSWYDSGIFLLQYVSKYKGLGLEGFSNDDLQALRQNSFLRL
ncbi:hypothetical protein VPH35_059051 [Triticum aestivum]